MTWGKEMVANNTKVDVCWARCPVQRCWGGTIHMKQSSGLLKMLIQITYEYVCNINVSEFWISAVVPKSCSVWKFRFTFYRGEKEKMVVHVNQGPLTIKTSRAELGVQPGIESRTLAPPKWRTTSEIWVKAALITWYQVSQDNTVLEVG